MDSEERDPKFDQRLDQWLDDALAGYTKAEPRPGLEQRITATLRAEERAPARRRWWLILTPATAALAVLVIFLALHPDRAVEKTTQTVAMQEAPASGYSTADTQPAAKENAKPAPANAAAAPLPMRVAPRTEVSTASARITPPAQNKSADIDLLADNKSAPPNGAIGGIISRNEAVPLSRNVATLPPPSTLAKAESTEPPDATGKYASAGTPPVQPASPSQMNETVEVSAASAPVMTAVPSAAGAGVPTLARKSAKSAARLDSSPYKLDFVLREFEDEKIVDQRNYTLTVRAGDWQQLRARGQVPTSSIALQQRDYRSEPELSVDCRILVASDGSAVLDTKANVNSFAPSQPANAGSSAPPLARHVQMSTSSPLIIGKPIVLTGVDQQNAKHRFQLEVTATTPK